VEDLLSSQRDLKLLGEAIVSTDSYTRELWEASHVDIVLDNHETELIYIDNQTMELLFFNKSGVDSSRKIKI
jgi:hypothetical protein